MIAPSFYYKELEHPGKALPTGSLGRSQIPCRTRKMPYPPYPILFEATWIRSAKGESYVLLSIFRIGTALTFCLRSWRERPLGVLLFISHISYGFDFLFFTTEAVTIPCEVVHVCLDRERGDVSVGANHQRASPLGEPTASCIVLLATNGKGI